MNTDSSDRSPGPQPVAPGLPPAASGPRAYLLTFACHGSWLHGDAAGSVDRRHNVHGTLVIRPDPVLVRADQARMDQLPYDLDPVRQGIVLTVIKEVCAHRGWWLFAVHVRRAHVHVVVQAGEAPERVLNDFKVYASRRLNETRTDPVDRKRWARHGSTRYLWTQADLESAIQYVLHEQGEPMAVYAGPGVTREGDGTCE